MPTQSEIQQIIQSLVPSSVNNGNPNTVYNSSPVPNTNGAGDWYVPQVNPAANLPGVSMPGMQWYGPSALGGGLGIPGLIRPGITPSGPGTGGPIAPIVIPPPIDPGPVIPPGSPLPVINGTGGGVGGPGIGGTDWNVYGISSPGSLGYVSNGGMGPSGSGGASPSTGGGGGFSLGGLGQGITNAAHEFGADWAAGNGLWGVSPQLAGALGLKPDGGIGIGQLLDVVTEPFFPGNFYNSQNGTFNWGTAAQNLLKIPFLNNMINQAAKRALNDNDPSNDNKWYVKLAKNKAENNQIKKANIAAAQANNAALGGFGRFFTPGAYTPPTKTPVVTVGDMVNTATGKVMPVVNNSGAMPGAGFGGSWGGAGGIYNAAPTTSSGDGLWNGYGSLNTTVSPKAPNSSQPSAAPGTTAPAAGGGGSSAPFARGQFGATVLQGDAARAAFAGMAAASDKAIAAALAAQANKSLR